METLFGKGYELTVKKELSQPGQFASNERVRVIGSKSEFPAVSILGPCRKETQVERNVMFLILTLIILVAAFNMISGVEGYEDYVLTGISGLSVGDEIFVPQPGEIPVVQRVFLISFGNGVLQYDTHSECRGKYPPVCGRVCDGYRDEQHSGRISQGAAGAI